MTSPARWRAPGRVNLIGEHTDYNRGWALPFAIDRSCVAEVELGGSTYHCTSAQAAESVEVDALPDGAWPDRLPGWAAYALGPAVVLRGRGYDVPPVRVHVDSTVPVGAGLSSSAAIVCAVATALDDALGLGLTADELLAVTRATENDVVGAPTGGLDQLASLRSREGHALLCDFEDLSSELIRFDPAAEGLAVLCVDTRSPHRHVDGEYAARRRGCESAARALGVGSLREVDWTDGLDAVLASLEPTLRPWVRHVVTENDRVLRTADLLRAGRLREIGPLLMASHASLRDDYRVTVPQLDVAAQTLEEAGALGARMTGGGFGGCVIALVPIDACEGAAAAVAAAFADRGFDAPEHFVVAPSAGAAPVEEAR